jgi:nucleoside-diphosphate-sugar epimerase
LTRPQRILVAGSPGFIGRHVVRAVREIQPDALVFGIGRADVNDHLLNTYLSAEVRAENLEVIQRYVTANRPDAVVNCLGSLAADHESAMQSNLRATEVLIQAVSSVVPGVEFVHLGSAAEYSPLKFPAKTDESTPTQPVSAYGKSKLLATRLVLEASEKGLISGAVLRVSNPLGPRMNPTTLPGKVSEFIRNPGENRLLLGSLSSYRDFVDVRDVSRAVMLSLSRLPAISGEIINIGSGVSRTARELVRGLLQISGRDATFQENLEGSSRSETMSWQQMDVAKAREVLGW